jgi:4-amino-4-deoxy-L-arabinose transferase-like glycosyltransferase
MKEELNKWFPWLTLLGILINATCLCNDILEPDGALYASIAKKIAISNDWINLYGNGSDWLDKPHLPFWLCAASIKIFGITAFAYKLPAFICWLIGVYYLYKLVIVVYKDDTIAKLSVLIYMSALHVVFANFDVRAEAFLTAFIIAATYYLFLLLKKNNVLHVLLAALFSALAIMTKGIFVMVTIASGFVLHWILTTQWQQFLNWKWWLVVLFTGVFILPELYALYVQFDAHPEKLVFEKTHVSGIRFFFWDSQFGRFFNNGPIKGEGDWLFFLHTSLWAFLPWTILLLSAVVNNIRNINLIKWQSKKLILGLSALTTFLLFSLSKFQLPHYIVIILPHFSVITANYLQEIFTSKTYRVINIVQCVLLILLSLLLMFVAYVFETKTSWLPIMVFVLFLVFLFWVIQRRLKLQLLLVSIAFVGVLFIFLNLFFYPKLMQYQGGMMAGKWLNEHGLKKKVLMYQMDSYNLEFYADVPVVWVNNQAQIDSMRAKEHVLLFSNQQELENLNNEHWKVKPIQTFNYFHISQLTFLFLNPKTRESVLTKQALAELIEQK